MPPISALQTFPKNFPNFSLKGRMNLRIRPFLEKKLRYFDYSYHYLTKYYKNHSKVLVYKQSTQLHLSCWIDWIKCVDWFAQRTKIDTLTNIMRIILKKLVRVVLFQYRVCSQTEYEYFEIYLRVLMSSLVDRLSRFRLQLMITDFQSFNSQPGLTSLSQNQMYFTHTKHLGQYIYSV